MALNPALCLVQGNVYTTPRSGPELHPVPLPDERFLLCRSGIRFDAAISSIGRLSGCPGRIYLSTVRIVFVANNPPAQLGSTSVHAVDLPLGNLRDETFNQPIFGANNITGKVVPSGTEVHSTDWKIEFREGGTGIFMPIFLRLLDQYRTSLLQPVQFSTNIASRTAFVDPNDPTVIYVSQPIPSTSIQE